MEKYPQNHGSSCTCEFSLSLGVECLLGAELWTWALSTDWVQRTGPMELLWVVFLSSGFSSKFTSARGDNVFWVSVDNSSPAENEGQWKHINRREYWYFHIASKMWLLSFQSGKVLNYQTYMWHSLAVIK